MSGFVTSCSTQPDRTDSGSASLTIGGLVVNTQRGLLLQQLPLELQPAAGNNLGTGFAGACHPLDSFLA